MTELNVRERNSLQVPITDAAGLTAGETLERLVSSPAGLPEEEAAVRLETLGPNAVRTHRANAWAVLGRQFASPILILLIVTAG
ncbi:MAG TPA: cation-transporting P-type ATPase, partial [Arthrobacter sp.]|nr:cation-transporting P-type ATPase [Arthrobacter sp.]